MNEWNTEELIATDKRFVWHPFTDMREWCAPEHEPLVLVEGHGAVLRDSTCREYIDGNSSIWTNIHGHNHPHINAAIRRQLSRMAHTSFLGFTNPAAIEFAQAIVALFPDTPLTKVFSPMMAQRELKWLSWRYCWCRQPGCCLDVPNQIVSVELSCHPGLRFQYPVGAYPSRDSEDCCCGYRTAYPRGGGNACLDIWHVTSRQRLA